MPPPVAELGPTLQTTPTFSLETETEFLCFELRNVLDPKSWTQRYANGVNPCD